MKILSLYFKNINSLVGENRIHFDQAPIADAGVFAITGTNGSGKSSILDAITLSLYGETFRFDRPAEHVMTKSTRESFAEIEFLLGNKRFKSRWQVDIATLSNPQMFLTQLDDEPVTLADNSQAVRQKIMALTGMDFHKFSKSMVLAQGDFAAFLNALDSERMAILEKISDDDIYQRYQQQAVDKLEQAKKQLLELEQDLIAVPIMDQASIEASKADLADYKARQTELKTELDNLQQLFNQLEQTDHLSDQLTGLTEKRQQFNRQIKIYQEQLEQIKGLENVQALEPELTEFDQKTEQLQQSQQTLTDYRDELNHLQQQLKSSDIDLSKPQTATSLSRQRQSLDQLQLKLAELKSELTREQALLQSLSHQKEERKQALTGVEHWLDEHAGDASLLTAFPRVHKLKRLRIEITELSEKIKDDAKWTKNINRKIKANNDKITALEQKNTDLNSEMEFDRQAIKALTEDHSFQELLDMAAEQKERINDFIELCDLASVYTKLNKKAFFKRLFVSQNRSLEIKTLVAKSEQLQLELGKEKNIARTLEQSIVTEALLKKMQPDRGHLVDGKPCPLCGALQHPYTRHPPAVSDSKQALADQQKKVKSLTTNLINLNKQIKLQQQQSEKEAEKELKLQAIYSQWVTLTNRLNIANEGFDIDQLSVIKGLLKTEKQQLVHITKLLKKYQKQEKSSAQVKTIIQANLTTLSRLMKETQQLTETLANRPDQSVADEQALQTCQQQEKQLLTQLQGQLEKLAEKIPAKGKESALFERLDNRRQFYQDKINDQKLLIESLQALDEKLADSHQRMDDIKTKIEQHYATIGQAESVGLQLALVEKQALIQEKELQVTRQHHELEQLRAKLQRQIKQLGSSIANIDELRKALELTSQQPALLQDQKRLNDNIQQIDQDIIAIQTQLTSKPISDGYDRQSLQIEIKSCQEKLDINRLEIETLQTKLDKQAVSAQKRQNIEEKLNQQKREFERCKAEMDLIRHDNGIHFRRKVQQELSDRLLSQTNRVLEKLSGRYYLRKADSEHGLALEIEDTKQANIRRLPKTLSGGESFIISLALALGLSELTHHGHAVDSFFLDEGFGNLDADSLYLVMSTLENLKTQGKLIGIISHVDGVKKRIKTQIEMVKSPNGLSSLRLVS